MSLTSRSSPHTFHVVLQPHVLLRSPRMSHAPLFHTASSPCVWTKIACDDGPIKMPSCSRLDATFSRTSMQSSHHSFHHQNQRSNPAIIAASLRGMAHHSGYPTTMLLQSLSFAGSLLRLAIRVAICSLAMFSIECLGSNLPRLTDVGPQGTVQKRLRG